MPPLEVSPAPAPLTPPPFVPPPPVPLLASPARANYDKYATPAQPTAAPSYGFPPAAQPPPPPAAYSSYAPAPAPAPAAQAYGQYAYGQFAPALTPQPTYAAVSPPYVPAPHALTYPGMPPPVENAVPEGWMLSTDQAGNPYYYNMLTGATSWARPSG